MLFLMQRAILKENEVLRTYKSNIVINQSINKGTVPSSFYNSVSNVNTTITDGIHSKIINGARVTQIRGRFVPLGR